MVDTVIRYLCQSITTILVVMVFGSLVQVPARAQDNLDQLQPGQVEQQFKSLPLPPVEEESFVPGRRSLGAPPNAQEIHFTLGGVRLSGHTVFDTAVLEELFRHRLNKELSLAEVYGIADDISRYYRRGGYVLTQAVLPEQEIADDGVVHIAVIEGYIANVYLMPEELAGANADLQPYIDALTAERPVTSATLERYVLFLNDLPGVGVSATLSPTPGGMMGAADMTIRLGQYRYQASASVDNRGSAFLGPYRTQLAFTRYGWLGAYASIEGQLVSTLNDELHYVSLRYRRPLIKPGWYGSLAMSGSSSEPGDYLNEALQIDNESTSVISRLEYHVTRSRRHNLQVFGGLALKDSESTRSEEGVDRDLQHTQDRVRVASLGARYDRIDRIGGSNLVEVEFAKGLDALGATATGTASRSRPAAVADFEKVALYATRRQRLPAQLQLTTTLRAQYASDDLPSVEQFGVGGTGFASAYDSSEIVGDTGVSARIELSKPLSTRPVWVSGLSMYGFVDGGRVKRNTPGDGQTRRASISSAGVGMRFRIKDRYTGSIEYTKPTSARTISSEQNRQGRLFIYINRDFN